MKHKHKMPSMAGYTIGVMGSGMVMGTMENASGMGTHMTADYVNASSKPIVPVMKRKGAGMVLNSLKGLKNPIKFKGAKKL